MTRSRHRPRVTGFALATLMALPGCGGAPSGPNVILISLDTTRADHLSVYGYERDTSPGLERLGERGVVFESAYTQAPNTAPSHTTLLSGLYPSVHRVWAHGMMPDPSLPMLPQLFRDAGYQTVAFVQLEGDTYRAGFEEYNFRGRRWSMDPERPQAMIDWMEQRGAEPFFMFVHTYEPHADYEPLDEYRRLFDQPYEGPMRHDRVTIDDLRDFNEGSVELSAADLHHIVALYDAEIAFTDERIGQLLDGVERLGLAGNTIIVLMADHGEELGERGQVGRHSYTIYNELMHVPLLMAGPGVAAGLRLDDAVGIVDIAPTLLDLAGIEAPSIYQGGSLTSLWRQPSDDTRYIVVERPGQQAIIGGGMKLHSDGRLFDLIADPGETRDVAADHAANAAFLGGRLDRWLAQVMRLQASVGGAGDVQLSPEERDRLKALGYVQ